MIFCLSMVDQVVDRILFGPWVDTELNNVGLATSKSGWSPIPGGFRALRRLFPRRHTFAVDKAAWDWTCPEWVARLYLLSKLSGGRTYNYRYILAASSRMVEVVGDRCVIRTPAGYRLRQLEFGIMKSGWLLTLSLNSAAQLYQHVVAAFRVGDYSPYLWAMGDDTIIRLDDEFDLDEYAAELSTTGCLLKFIHNSREFMGFDFNDDKLVVPLYQDKHKFILDYLSPDLEQETLLSYWLQDVL